MQNLRKLLTGAAMAAAMSLGAASVPAEAQPQVGLVNVSIGDVEILNDVSLGLAANVAAQICGVQAAVLAQQFLQTGEATCTSRSGRQTVTLSD